MSEPEPTPGTLRTSKGTRILPSVNLNIGTKSHGSKTTVKLPIVDAQTIAQFEGSNGTGPNGTRIMPAISTEDCRWYSGGVCSNPKNKYGLCPHPTSNRRLYHCQENQKAPLTSQGIIQS